MNKGMTLGDFIECIGVVLYGKGRFFAQDDGDPPPQIWYDRDKCDYVSTETVLQRIYDEVQDDYSRFF